MRRRGHEPGRSVARDRRRRGGHQRVGGRRGRTRAEPRTLTPTHTRAEPGTLTRTRAEPGGRARDGGRGKTGPGRRNGRTPDRPAALRGPPAQPGDLRSRLVGEQPVVRDPQLRPEQRGDLRPRPARLERDDLAQHSRQLVRHLLRRGEAPARIGVGGPYQQPVERLVPPEHLDVLRVRQRVHEDVGVPLEVEGQDGQRARHRVQVGGDRGADLRDLRRLVAHGAVDGRLLVVHPPHRAHVDQLQLVGLLDGVVDLEVAVQEVPAVQVAERLQGLDAVRAGLLHGQRIAPPVRPPPLVGDLLERFAADVLHHDVPVQRTGPLVQVLHEVVDPHDVGVLDLREEAPLRDRGRHGVLVAGVQQALEHHPPVRDGPVHREVDPAEAAVREAARDLVLAVDQVTRVQLRHEGVRVPALGAETFRPSRPLTARPAHRSTAVRARAEPLALRDLRILQHRLRRIRTRYLRYVDQPCPEPAAARGRGGRARTAHRHRPGGRGARERAREPARHGAPGGGRPRGPRGPRGGRGGGPPGPVGPLGALRIPVARRARHRRRHRHQLLGARRDRAGRREAAGVAVQLAAAHVLIRAGAAGAHARRRDQTHASPSPGPAGHSRSEACCCCCWCPCCPCCCGCCCGTRVSAVAHW